MKFIKTLIFITILIFALVGFSIVSRNLNSQQVLSLFSVIQPSPTPKIQTPLEIARGILQKNPNYSCPSMWVMDTWLGKFKNLQTISAADLFNDDSFKAACWYVYQQQYADEAQTVIRQNAQRKNVYVPVLPPLPQFHSQTCSVYGNRISCFGY